VFWGHRYALALFGPMAARVGMDPKKDDSHADAMLRPMLIGRAGKLGDAKIVAECKARFAKFVAGDDSAVHPDIRGAVCVVPHPLNPVPERSCGWIESAGILTVPSDLQVRCGAQARRKGRV
jgi:hypothetical protein